jgi:thymidylate synthase
MNTQSCRTVASTIFPNSLWTPDADDSADQLYARYEKLWPTIKKCPANRNGVYFRRLTAYRPKYERQEAPPVNQLKHVIDTYRSGNHRHSALQASIFDPTRDHVHSPRRGFPCLQQVSFGASPEGTLDVTGFYALQHHVPKAYGNYLGLCWLGRYMARQMDLRLTQVTCIASSLKLPHADRYNKTNLTPLKTSIEQVLNQHQMRAA